jgi:hypothetical protein
MRDNAMKTLKMIADGTIKPSTKKVVNKSVKKDKIVRLPTSMLASINKGYEDSQDEAMNLDESNIQKVFMTGNVYNIELNDFELDDEPIDLIKMTPTELGFETELLQNVDIKGTMRFINYFDFLSMNRFIVHGSLLFSKRL